jgi:hypothetical protein
MDALDKAVEQLAAAAGPGRGSVHETYEGLAAVLDEAEHAEPAARGRALRRLAEVIVATDVTRASLVALGCGALVESGGDPHLALGAILARLPPTLKQSATFAEMCRALAEEPPEDLDIPPDEAAEESDEHETGTCVDEFGAMVAEELPEESQAWTALEPLCMGAIAMLSRSLAARRQTRANTELLAALQELGRLHRRAVHLANLLRVLDDEELIVLHPGADRGYRVRIRGVGDNFQLHTLLADALHGDPDRGWLSGTRPDPRVVAAARNRVVDRSVGVAVGFFLLVDWHGLRADATMCEASEHVSCWLPGEGIPADIPLFEGMRVLLLAPPAFPQTWDANRTFEGMEADLQVVEVLTPEAVRDWLGRIARARAAGST